MVTFDEAIVLLQKDPEKASELCNSMKKDYMNNKSFTSLIWETGRLIIEVCKKEKSPSDVVVAYLHAVFHYGLMVGMLMEKQGLK